MPTELTNLSDASREAVHTARDAAQALEVARQMQIIDRTEMAAIIREQLTAVLAGGSEHERELILARVPYICNDIKTINTNIAKLTDMLGTYPIIRNLVFGGAGMILTAVMSALIYLVVIK